MRGAVMGSAGRVPCPAPLRKGSDPREQSKSPKPWLLLAWQELIARLKAAGRGEGLGMRHRTCRFAIPNTGSARSFSSSVPFLTSTKDRDAAPSFAASLRATYKRAHTTDKWVYSSQAAPASQLDKNLKRNKNITKKKNISQNSICFQYNFWYLCILQSFPLHLRVETNSSVSPP